jgi:hypothetical protein
VEAKKYAVLESAHHKKVESERASERAKEMEPQREMETKTHTNDSETWRTWLRVRRVRSDTDIDTDQTHDTKHTQTHIHKTLIQTKPPTSPCQYHRDSRRAMRTFEKVAEKKYRLKKEGGKKKSTQNKGRGKKEIAPLTSRTGPPWAKRKKIKITW